MNYEEFSKFLIIEPSKDQQSGIYEIIIDLTDK